MVTPKADSNAKSSTGVMVVDMQGDFTVWKNGSMAVTETGQDFVENVQQATLALSAGGHIIFGTQDWHPARHVSFFTNHAGKKPFDTLEIGDRSQILWPPQGSK